IREPGQEVLGHREAARTVRLGELIADDPDARKLLADRVLEAALALEPGSGAGRDAENRDRAAPAEPLAHPARGHHAALIVVGGDEADRSIEIEARVDHDDGNAG